MCVRCCYPHRGVFCNFSPFLFPTKGRHVDRIRIFNFLRLYPMGLGGQGGAGVLGSWGSGGNHESERERAYEPKSKRFPLAERRKVVISYSPHSRTHVPHTAHTQPASTHTSRPEYLCACVCIPLKGCCSGFGAWRFFTVRRPSIYHFTMAF